MPDMLIRDVPDPTHAEVKRRAEAAGMSLQSFVRKMLEDEVAKPSLSDWLNDIRRLDPVDTEMSGAEAVAAGREDG